MSSFRPIRRRIIPRLKGPSDMNPIARPRPIRLLTLDAFGTLYAPRALIGTQYVSAARRHGLEGIEDCAADVEEKFREVFRIESKKRPNYGKSVGMNASEWWANVIRSTLLPFLKPSTSLPEGLIPDLLNQFSSSRGYTLHADVLPFFDHLRRARKCPDPYDPLPSLRVGIISNSDDRVPSILDSLGLRVGPRRYGMSSEPSNRDRDDIDFVALSYDVGAEKPDRKMFDAARELGGELEPDECLHVGDDLVKDVQAAEAAGWHSVIVDRSREKKNSLTGESGLKVEGLVELVLILRMGYTDHLH